MSPPSAIQTGTITPPEEKTSGLVKSGVAHSLETTAPSLLKQANGVSGGGLSELDASEVAIKRAPNLREVPDTNSTEAWANAVCSDHMLTAQWDNKQGWHQPSLEPYGALSLLPTASVLHYATECFEGLKLYRGHDGRLRLFRPDLNAARMLMSATRIGLPGFAPAELTRLIARLCAADGPRWLPRSKPGKFMYVRPSMISNDPTIGMAIPKRALLFVLLCCMPDFASGIHGRGSNAPGTAGKGKGPGMRLLASRDDMCRAWPGGFGYAKVGANYGPSLVAHGEAAARGYDQILWLFGERGFITEAGASNFFVVWQNRDTGRRELVTAPLDGKIILDGVTRRSVLDLARAGGEGTLGGLGELDVVEREFTMDEVEQAVREGRIVEAFSVGTAYFVVSVSNIHFRGVDLDIPLEDGHMGRYARYFKTEMEDIMYGRKEHPWGVVIDEEPEEEEVVNGIHH